MLLSLLTVKVAVHIKLYYSLRVLCWCSGLCRGRCRYFRVFLSRCSRSYVLLFLTFIYLLLYFFALPPYLFLFSVMLPHFYFTP
jgi:hypothetical protein